eukprot:919701_1
MVSSWLLRCPLLITFRCILLIIGYNVLASKASEILHPICPITVPRTHTIYVPPSTITFPLSDHDSTALILAHISRTHVEVEWPFHIRFIDSQYVKHTHTSNVSIGYEIDEYFVAASQQYPFHVFRLKQDEIIQFIDSQYVKHMHKSRVCIGYEFDWYFFAQSHQYPCRVFRSNRDEIHDYFMNATAVQLSAKQRNIDDSSKVLLNQTVTPVKWNPIPNAKGTQLASLGLISIRETTVPKAASEPRKPTPSAASQSILIRLNATRESMDHATYAPVDIMFNNTSTAMTIPSISHAQRFDFLYQYPKGIAVSRLWTVEFLHHKSRNYILWIEIESHAPFAHATSIIFFATHISLYPHVSSIILYDLYSISSFAQATFIRLSTHAAFIRTRCCISPFIHAEYIIFSPSHDLTISDLISFRLNILNTSIVHVISSALCPHVVSRTHDPTNSHYVSNHVNVSFAQPSIIFCPTHDHRFIHSISSSCKTDGLYYIKPTVDGAIIPVLCNDGYTMLDASLNYDALSTYFTTMYKYGDADKTIYGTDCSDSSGWRDWYTPANENTKFRVARNCESCTAGAAYGDNTAYYMTSGYFCPVEVDRDGCSSEKRMAGQTVPDIMCNVCDDEDGLCGEGAGRTGDSLYDTLSDPSWCDCYTLQLTPDHLTTSTHDEYCQGNINWRPNLVSDRSQCTCYQPLDEEVIVYDDVAMDDLPTVAVDYKEDIEALGIFIDGLIQWEEDDSDTTSKKACLLKEAVYLTGDDFVDGTYRITECGHYLVSEDIVVNFNKPDATFDYEAGDSPNTYNLDNLHWFPTNAQQDSGEYFGLNAFWGPYSIGFMAAITIETSHVWLDLQGHSISMEYEFYLQQRFFAIIELGNKQFEARQGPVDFGRDD